MNNKPKYAFEKYLLRAKIGYIISIVCAAITAVLSIALLVAMEAGVPQ